MSDNNSSDFSHNTFSSFLKAKFNNRHIYKLTIDAGFTCPNRDGTKSKGGCTYCDVGSFTLPEARDRLPVAEQVRKHMAMMKEKRNAEGFIIYFQPFSNTYAEAERLREIYDEALTAAGDEACALAVGTRADCLKEDRLQVLGEMAQKLYVILEIGLESIYDRTLKRINRGHSHADFLETTHRVVKLQDKVGRDRLGLCLHVVFGLPGESREEMLAYVDVINRISPQFVKFHHLHLVRDTEMAREYAIEPFELFTMESYTNLLCDLLPRLDPGIVIQRLFATTYPGTALAPHWQDNSGRVRTYMRDTFRERKIIQGAYYNKS